MNLDLCGRRRGVGTSGGMCLKWRSADHVNGAALLTCSESESVSAESNLTSELAPFKRVPKSLYPEIVRMYESGMNCPAIASAIDARSNRVYRILRKLGVVIRPSGAQKGETSRNKGHKWKSDHRRITGLPKPGKVLKPRIYLKGPDHPLWRNGGISSTKEYKNTKTIAQRAKRSDVSAMTDLHRTIIDIYQNGATAQQTANQTVVTPAIVYNTLKKFGIPRRSGGVKVGTLSPKKGIKLDKPNSLLGKRFQNRWKPDSPCWTGIDSKSPEYARANSLKWQRENKDRVNDKIIRRKRNTHTPAWADQEAIRKLYHIAIETGMTVDHIIPIQNPIVCGLHVETNLQLLTRAENGRKGNRYDGEFIHQWEPKPQ